MMLNGGKQYRMLLGMCLVTCTYSYQPPVDLSGLHRIIRRDISPVDPPSGVPTRDTSDNNSVAAKKRRTISYDLGLGKNPSVVARRKQHSFTSASATIHDATKYLVEHQATREFPAPHQDHEVISRASSTETTSSVPPSTAPAIKCFGKHLKQESRTIITRTETPPKTQKNTVVPKPNFRRRLDDCLSIVDDLHGRSGRTMMLVTPHTPQLDVNSVWVEMLIHNQQRQSM